MLINDPIYLQAFIRSRISQDPDVGVRVEIQYCACFYRSGLIWCWMSSFSQLKLSSLAEELPLFSEICVSVDYGSSLRFKKKVIGSRSQSRSYVLDLEN